MVFRSIFILCALLMLSMPASADPPIISSEAQCEAVTGGKWVTNSGGTGCLVKRKRQGRWVSLPGGRDCWRRTYQKNVLHGEAWGALLVLGELQDVDAGDGGGQPFPVLTLVQELLELVLRHEGLVRFRLWRG